MNWISIDKELPPEGKLILVNIFYDGASEHLNFEIQYVCRYSSTDRFKLPKQLYLDGYNIKITHWKLASDQPKVLV